jgi:hypothetical protein
MIFITQKNRGNPNIPGRLYGENGNLKQKRWYGDDGLPVRDRDYDHPGSMDFPHDHDWYAVGPTIALQYSMNRTSVIIDFIIYLTTKDGE